MSTRNTTEESRLPVFLFFSDEVQDLVHKNDVDLLHELRKQLFDVELGRIADPAAATGEKGAELVILAAGAVAPLVLIGIAKIIDALGRNKRVVVSHRECRTVRDKDGNPLLDADGQPRMEWVDTARLLEPQAQDISVKYEAHILGASFTLDESK